MDDRTSDVVSPKALAAALHELFSPRVIAAIDDTCVQVVRAHGSHLAHPRKRRRRASEAGASLQQRSLERAALVLADGAPRAQWREAGELDGGRTIPPLMLPTQVGLDGSDLRGHVLFHHTRDGRRLAAIREAAQRMICEHAICIARARAVFGGPLDLAAPGGRLIAETLTRSLLIILAAEEASQQHDSHSRS